MEFSMWKPENTPNLQIGVFLNSQPIDANDIPNRSTRNKEQGTQIYLQFRRVLPEVAGIWPESGCPKGISKNLQNRAQS